MGVMEEMSGNDETHISIVRIDVAVSESHFATSNTHTTTLQRQREVLALCIFQDQRAGGNGGNVREASQKGTH